MFNDRIIKSYSVSLYLKEMNKIHKTKAIFNQGDRKTSIIIVQLLEDKSSKNPIDLTGSKVIAKIMKSDNTTSNILCSILDKENGYVAIGLTEQALLALGENIIELEIQCNSQILYTPKMSYTVVDNLYDESELIRSQDEFPVLSSLIANVQTVENELASLEMVLNNNENIRNSNEEARKSNEITRNNDFEDIKNRINNLVNSVNEKIEEMSSSIKNSENAIVLEINSTLNAKSKEVDNKINECNSILSSTTILSEKITNDENVRNQNEQNRINTFNSITAELEVTQSDIDDILGMIGGL